MAWSRKVLLSVILASVVLAVYFCYTVVKAPYLGIELTHQEEQYVIDELDPKGIGYNSELEPGDIILQVDEKSPLYNTQVTMFKGIEQVAYIKVLRGNREIEVSFSEEITSAQAYDYLYIPTVFFLLCFIVCMFIFQRRKNIKSAELLCYLFLAIGLSTFSASASARGDILASSIVSLILVIVPVLLLHFIYTYYKERFNLILIRKKYINLLYVIVFMIIASGGVGIYLADIHSLFNTIELSFFLITFIYMIYFLLSKTYQYRSTKYSPPLKILNFGVILAFSPFVCLYLIPTLMFNKVILQAETAAVFILILPLSFVYLIMSKRLFDIDFVLSRIRYNMFLSIILEVILITLFVVNFPNHLTSFEFFYFGFLLFFTLNLFFYILDFSNNQIRAVLLTEKNNFNDSLYRFLANMKDEMKISDVIKHLDIELSSVLGVKELEVFQVHKKSNLICLESAKNLKEFQKISSRIHHSNVGSIIEIDTGFGLIIGETSDSYLVLLSSRKSNMTALNREEKEWLKALSFYANVSIENIRKVEDLLIELEGIRIDQKHTSKWLSKLMFSLSEKERKSISEDIHDTVLQEQIILSRKLEDVIFTYSKLSNSQIYEEVEKVKEGLLDNIYITREICNELRPPFIKQVGLGASINELIRKYQLKSDLLVHFTHQIEDEIDNEEMLISIYRIIQELLNNTVKHSGASKADVFIEQIENSIQVLFKDNGKGFSFISANKEGHLGLRSIIERVQSLEGTITFNSEDDKGLEVQILLDSMNGVKV